MRLLSRTVVPVEAPGVPAGATAVACTRTARGAGGLGEVGSDMGSCPFYDRVRDRGPSILRPVPEARGQQPQHLTLDSCNMAAGEHTNDVQFIHHEN